MDAGILKELSAEELQEALDQSVAARCAVHQSELELVWALDERGDFKDDGATSMAAWLSYRYGWSSYFAQLSVRVARALACLPAIRDAYGQGRLCWEQVEALSRYATANTESELLQHALKTDATQLKALLRSLEPVSTDEAQDAHRRRYLRYRWDLDRRVLHLKALLPDVEGKLVAQALDHLTGRGVGALAPGSGDGVYGPGVHLNDSGNAAGGRFRQRQDPAAGNAPRQRQDPAVGNDPGQHQDPAAGNAPGQHQDPAAGNAPRQRQDPAAGPGQHRDDMAPADNCVAGRDVAQAQPLSDRAEILAPGAPAVFADHYLSRGPGEAGEERPTYQQICADALVRLAGTYLQAQGDAPRATVVVHAELAALADSQNGIASLESGPMIAGDTARRLACDCDVELVVEGPDRQPIGIGRRSRQIPGWLLRQLRHRDQTCRFPGCDRHRWIQAHHQQHWAQGGPTDLPNLVLLCWDHHRLVHEGGWRLQGSPEDWLDFVSPDGRTLTSLPPPALDPALRKTLFATFYGDRMTPSTAQ